MKLRAEFSELSLISKSNRKWPEMAKTKIVWKNQYMLVLEAKG